MCDIEQIIRRLRRYNRRTVLFLYAEIAGGGRLPNGVTVLAVEKEQRVLAFGLDTLDKRLYENPAPGLGMSLGI